MTALVALPTLTAAPPRGPLLAAEGAQALKQHRPDLAREVTLLVELGGRAYGALLPAVPPAVALQLAAGDRRGAAESLARLDNRGEVHEGAVTVALAHVAPHLTAEARALAYGEDLRTWLARRQVADDMGAPWDEVDVDHDAEVDRCLIDLVGGA